MTSTNTSSSTSDYDNDKDALLEAIKINNNPLIESLLAYKPSLANITTGNGDSILHYALECCQTDLVISLIDFDPSLLNSVNARQETILHSAIRTKSLILIEILLNFQPNLLNIVIGNGSSILHYAFECGHQDLVIFLVKKQPTLVKCVNSNQETVLHNAIKTKNISLVEFFLKNYPSLAKVLIGSGDSILHYAVEQGYPDVVISIITISPFLLQCTNTHHETVLHYAVKYYNSNVFDQILHYKENLQEVNTKGENVLHYAIKFDNSVVILKVYSSLMDTFYKDKHIMHYAIKYAKKQETIFTLLECKGDLLGKLKNMDTIFHNVVKYGKFYLPNLLSQCKELNDKGENVLLYSIKYKRTNIFHQIMEKYTDLINSSINAIGENSLHYAIKYNNQEVIDFLFTKFKNSYLGNDNILMYSIKHANPDMLEYLLNTDKNFINQFDSIYGKTVLHYALDNDRPEIAITILKIFPELNARDKNNDIVKYAIENGHISQYYKNSDIDSLSKILKKKSDILIEHIELFEKKLILLSDLYPQFKQLFELIKNKSHLPIITSPDGLPPISFGDKLNILLDTLSKNPELAKSTEYNNLKAKTTGIDPQFIDEMLKVISMKNLLNLLNYIQPISKEFRSMYDTLFRASYPHFPNENTEPSTKKNYLQDPIHNPKVKINTEFYMPMNVRKELSSISGYLLMKEKPIKYNYKLNEADFKRVLDIYQKKGSSRDDAEALLTASLDSSIKSHSGEMMLYNSIYHPFPKDIVENELIICPPIIQVFNLTSKNVTIQVSTSSDEYQVVYPETKYLEFGIYCMNLRVKNLSFHKLFNQETKDSGEVPLRFIFKLYYGTRLVDSIESPTFMFHNTRATIQTFPLYDLILFKNEYHIFGSFSNTVDQNGDLLDITKNYTISFIRISNGNYSQVIKKNNLYMKFPFCLAFSKIAPELQEDEIYKVFIFKDKIRNKSNPQLLIKFKKSGIEKLPIEYLDTIKENGNKNNNNNSTNTISNDDNNSSSTSDIPNDYDSLQN